MTMMVDLPAGFADKGASAQSCFRAVMDAMARPGSFQRISATCGSPKLLMRGSAAIALMLFDQDTPIWLDPTLAATLDVATWIKFHTGAPVVAEPSQAGFAMIADAAGLPDFDRFALGSNDDPDRSVTLVVQVESLSDGAVFELSGPGIDGTAIVRATHQFADLPDRLARNARLFPRGVDLILIADDSIVAIPRTTRLVAKEG